VPVFCRHNRFTAECPICSKGTALDQSARAGSRPRSSGRAGAAAKRQPAAAPVFTGPYAATRPYEDDHGRYEVRLERVPGGIRLAEWSGGRMRRRAPVLEAADLSRLVRTAGEHRVLEENGRALETALGAKPREPSDAPAGGAAPQGGEAAGEEVLGRSPGWSGELRDELRVERLADGRLRVARWILRPNAGWELQETPVMLPAPRYAEALAGAALTS
jgi:hypothetical protein